MNCSQTRGCVGRARSRPRRGQQQAEARLVDGLGSAGGVSGSHSLNRDRRATCGSNWGRRRCHHAEYFRSACPVKRSAAAGGRWGIRAAQDPGSRGAGRTGRGQRWHCGVGCSRHGQQGDGNAAPINAGARNGAGLKHGIGDSGGGQDAEDGPRWDDVQHNLATLARVVWNE